MGNEIVITTTAKLILPDLVAVFPLGASAASDGGLSAVGPFTATGGGVPTGESAAGALLSAEAFAEGVIALEGEGAVVALEGAGAVPVVEGAGAVPVVPLEGAEAVPVVGDAAAGGLLEGGCAGLTRGVGEGDEEGGVGPIMAEGIMTVLICTTEIL